MVFHRLIPVVLIRHGVCVQSKGFSRYQSLGSPGPVIARLSDYASDELIVLDISQEEGDGGGRRDVAYGTGSSRRETLEYAASSCFMPLTFGGLVRSVASAAEVITGGADKVAMTSWPLDDAEAIDRCAREFGSQCVVVGVDVMRDGDGCHVMTGRGRVRTGRDACGWAREAADRGAGEILLQSVDRDGRGGGYDLGLIEAVSAAVSVPVIALGGVGNWGDLAAGVRAGAAAVAAANIFQHSEHSVVRAKRALIEAGVHARPAAGCLEVEV